MSWLFLFYFFFWNTLSCVIKLNSGCLCFKVFVNRLLQKERAFIISFWNVYFRRVYLRFLFGIRIVKKEKRRIVTSEMEKKSILCKNVKNVYPSGEIWKYFSIFPPFFYLLYYFRVLFHSSSALLLGQVAIFLVVSSLKWTEGKIQWCK